MSAQFNTNLQLRKEHCVDIAKREMSSYVNLCVITNGYSAMQSIKGEHPWITEFAFNSDAEEELLYRVDLFWTHEHYVETYPFEKKTANQNLAKNTVNHFKTHKVDVFLENEWSHNIVASINAPGVIRAMVFQSKNAEEMQLLIRLLMELKVADALRKNHIASIGAAQHKADSATRLFESISHFYKVIYNDFGKYDATCKWFERVFAAHRNSQGLGTMRQNVIQNIMKCDSMVIFRQGLIPRYEKLIRGLRSMVMAADPREIPHIRNMINEAKTSHGMQALLKGVPMPTFQPELLVAAIEKVEQEKHIAEFLRADGVEPFHEEQEDEYTSSEESDEEQGEAKNIDTMMQSVTSHLHVRRNIVFEDTAAEFLNYALDRRAHSPRTRPPPPAEVLEKALSVKKELAAIQDLAGACAAVSQNLVAEEALNVMSELKDIQRLSVDYAAELQNLKIAAVSEVAREVRRIQEETTQATIELQTAQYDQQRRAIRREVKRIREVRETAIRQMLPFFAEQLQQRAVYEAKQRIKEEEKRIRAVAKEATRLQQLVTNLKQETATLLEQHNSQQRRRMFLAVAPVFLPTAMFETDVDCGLCLQTLDWKRDQTIAYVTCCPEFGYVCTGCQAAPHTGHSLVMEREIVRIVRGVRRAAGIF